MKRKLLSLLLALCMVLAMLPATAFADTTGSVDSVYCFRQNPLFPETADDGTVVYHYGSVLPAESSGERQTYLSNLEEAAAALRAGLERRETEIVIKTFCDDDDFDDYTADSGSIYNYIWHRVFDSAFEHTGVGTQGDYLGLWRNAHGNVSSGNGGYTISYSITHYTTAEQEKAVTDRLAQVMASFGFTSQTDDYTKVKKIYDYVCSHVTYDYANLNDSSYRLKYTAYAALIDGTAVCNGYALLMYRMLLDAGVDARFVSGDNHAWNIVKLNGCYYNLDSTWDAGRSNYRYFLKCPTTFDTDHTRYEKFNTAEFHAAYPMSALDYGQAPISGTCGSGVYWKLASTTLEITGSGWMSGYANSSAPWAIYSDSITSVTVADGVLCVGNSAFRNHTTLTRITLADSVQSIYNGAFLGCSALTDVNLPDTLIVIDPQAFQGCSALKNITLPDSLTSIGWQAFCGSSLKEIAIPDSVTYIGVNAFSGCRGLVAATIGDSVETIEKGAFRDCTSLKEITIPDSVTDIDDYAFSYCTNLEKVVFSGEAPSFGVGCFEGNTTTAYYPCNDNTWTSDKRQDYGGDITWKLGHNYENGICTRCRRAGTCGSGVYWTYSSTKLEITGSGWMSGYANSSAPWAIYADSITSVTVGDGVLCVGNSAFRNHTALTSISLADSVQYIYNGAFLGCSALTDVNLPDTLIIIDPQAFQGCSVLKNITLPDGLTSVGWQAFCGCTSLEKIAIPDNVTYIGVNAFSGSGLKKITFTGDLPTIDTGCFNATTPVVYYPCNNDTWSETAVQALADTHTSVTWKANHSETTVTGKAATCTATGLTDGKKCSICGDITVKQQAIDKKAHEETTVTGRAATCTATGLTDGKKCSVCGTVTVKQQTIAKTAHKETTVTGQAATCTTIGLTAGKECSVCGTVTVKQQTIAKLAHSYKNGTCTMCGGKDPNYVPPVDGVDRVYGSSRYDTAFQSADTLKKQMGVEKFSCAIVTSGDNFADALAGSYLAYVKNAPILLTDNDNIGDVMAYIQKNVEKGATVYALGGKAVVTDKLLDLEKKGYDVKRLAGKSRFETNLEILKECGSVAGKDILVCTGFNFADSLSASAAKRPILLVDDKLTDGQKAYLKQQSGCKYCIVGGTGAVTSSVEKSLKSYGSVSRLAGSNRFETSVMVAKKFFSNPTTAVLAYGYNFPDGLCAGPLAATINAPLILTATGDEAQAAAYAKEEGIKDGYVLGGSALINDKAVKKIFSMSSGDKIQ